MIITKVHSEKASHDVILLNLHECYEIVNVTPRQSIPSDKFLLENSPDYDERIKELEWEHAEVINITTLEDDEKPQIQVVFKWIDKEQLRNYDSPKGYKIIFPLNKHHYKFYTDFLIRDNGIAAKC